MIIQSHQSRMKLYDFFQFCIIQLFWEIKFLPLRLNFYENLDVVAQIYYLNQGINEKKEYLF